MNRPGGGIPEIVRMPDKSFPSFGRVLQVEDDVEWTAANTARDQEFLVRDEKLPGHIDVAGLRGQGRAEILVPERMLQLPFR